MTRLRWGVMGAGSIARSQVRDMKLHGMDVRGVAARDLSRARAWADSNDVPQAYGSYEEMAAADDIDAVYVATVHPAHAQAARIALHGGKHVLVEKPLTLDAAQAQELADLAEKQGLVLLEAMWTRWLPHMVRIREIVAEGLLGDVRAVLADHSQRIEHIPRLAQSALGGGALLDLGIYPVSFAWDLLGAPSSVLARATFTEAGVDRETSIILSYPTGAAAVIHTQMSGIGPCRASVIGTEGRIDIDGVWYAQTSFTRYDAQGESVEQFRAPVEGRGMHLQAEELERLVAAGTTAGAVLPPSESVAIMRTMDQIRSCIDQDRPRST